MFRVFTKTKSGCRQLQVDTNSLDKALDIADSEDIELALGEEVLGAVLVLAVDNAQGV